MPRSASTRASKARSTERASRSRGSTSTPFGDRKEAAVDIDFDALALPGYVQYVPLPQGLKLTDGALTTRLKLAFVSEKGEPRTATLSGTARVDRLAVTRSDGSPLIGARSIAVTLGKLDPLGRAVVLENVTIEAPDVDLRRGTDGIFEFQRLLAPDAGPAGSAGRAPAARAGAAPWTYSVAELHVAGGTVRVADEGVSPAFRVALSKRQDRRARRSRRAATQAPSKWTSTRNRARISAPPATSISRRARHAAISR